MHEHKFNCLYTYIFERDNSVANR